MNQNITLRCADKGDGDRGQWVKLTHYPIGDLIDCKVAALSAVQAADRAGAGPLSKMRNMSPWVISKSGTNVVGMK